MKGFTSRIAMAIAMLVLVVACGDSGSVTTAPSPATTPDATGTIPVTVGDLPGVSDSCEALLNVFLSFSAVLTGTDRPNFDVIEGLPSELEDDAALMLTTLNAYFDGLEDLGIDLTDPQSLTELTEEKRDDFTTLIESLDTEEFNAAADNLEAYATTECEEFAPAP